MRLSFRRSRARTALIGARWRPTNALRPGGTAASPLRNCLRFREPTRMPRGLLHVGNSLYRGERAASSDVTTSHVEARRDQQDR